MIVGPPRRRNRPRPIALVIPGYRALSVETLDGIETAYGQKRCYDALVRYQDHVLFTTGAMSRFAQTTGARAWQGLLWRGRLTSMTLRGTKVRILSLRGTLESSPDPFGDLVTAITWLSSHGVNPASISSMAWSLWRNSLEREYRIGAPPRISRPALFGGRQEVPRAGTYQHMVGADITAAYPWSMQTRPYALGLREVDASTTITPDVAGLIEGLIEVDGQAGTPPVPYRLGPDVVTYPTGPVEGTWTWAEALAAEELGHRVHVDRCYAPMVEADLFGGWWERVQDGRELPGAAATLVKGCANSLWGMFAMRGDGGETIHWRDDWAEKPVVNPVPERHLPQAYLVHIAAETTSRVRVRMLTEGCNGFGAAPVHIDTDGVIIRKSAAAGLSREPVPGQWRVKTPMRTVDVRNPQVYRYLCTPRSCGIDHKSAPFPWHYSVAGVPQSEAPAVFEKRRRIGPSVSFNGRELIVASFNLTDRRKVEAALTAAQSAKELQ